MDQSQFAQTPAGLDALMRDFVDYREYVLAATRAPRDFILRLNAGKYHGHEGTIDCRKIHLRGDADLPPKWCIIKWQVEWRFRSAGPMPFILFECVGSEPSERDIEKLHSGFVETKKDFIKQINEARAARQRLQGLERQQFIKDQDARLNFYWGKTDYDLRAEAWRQRSRM